MNINDFYNKLSSYKKVSGGFVDSKGNHHKNTTIIGLFNKIVVESRSDRPIPLNILQKVVHLIQPDDPHKKKYTVHNPLFKEGDIGLNQLVRTTDLLMEPEKFVARMSDKKYRDVLQNKLPHGGKPMLLEALLKFEEPWDALHLFAKHSGLDRSNGLRALDMCYKALPQSAGQAWRWIELAKSFGIDCSKDKSLVHDILSAGPSVSENLLCHFIEQSPGIDYHKWLMNDTPLSLACSKGLSKVALKLIEKGAIINQFDAHKESPLIWACDKGMREVALALIEKGANVNHVNGNNESPLTVACWRGLSEVALALIEKGAYVNQVNLQDTSPLHLACSKGLSTVALELIKRDANVNQVNKRGESPLTLACSKKLPEVALELIKRGANVNQLLINGTTLLDWACEQRSSEVALALIDRGADVNQANKYGDTPLHVSCKYGLTSVSKALYDKNPSLLNRKNNQEETPLYWASMRSLHDKEMRQWIKPIAPTRVQAILNYLDDTSQVEALPENLHDLINLVKVEPKKALNALTRGMSEYSDGLFLSLEERMLLPYIEQTILQGLDITAHPISTSVKRANSDLGTFVERLNGPLISGGHLKITRRILDGKEQIEFDFQLTKEAREFIYPFIVGKSVPYTYPKKMEDGTFSTANGMSIGKAIKMTFPQGELLIGAEEEVGNLYRKVKVRVGTHDACREFLTILSQVGLGSIAAVGNPEQEKALKRVAIGRAYAPREFEKGTVPDYLLKKYENDAVAVKREEIYPGKSVYAVGDLANDIYAVGGRMLFHGIGGASKGSDFKVSCDITAKISQSGILSAQTRFDSGAFVIGSSSKVNHSNGSADTVFTRLVTEAHIEKRVPIANFGLFGDVQFLIDLKAAEKSGWVYAYENHQQGGRNRADLLFKKVYEKRSNLVEHAQKIEERTRQKVYTPKDLDMHELMIRDRIPPQFIRGIVVQSEQKKIELIQALRRASCIQEGMFNGIPVWEFVHVGSVFNQSLLKNFPQPRGPVDLLHDLFTKFPTIAGLPARHKKLVSELMLSALKQGLPNFQGESINDQFIKQFQFIVKHLSQMDNPKEILEKLAKGFQDCQPIQQQTVDDIYATLHKTSDSFELQFKNWHLKQMTDLMGIVVQQLHPNEQGAWPHLINAYKVKFQLGDHEVAKLDPNARQDRLHPMFREECGKLYDLSIAPRLVDSVNLHLNDPNGAFTESSLIKWAQEHDCLAKMYNNGYGDAVYPLMTPEQENMEKPCLCNEAAEFILAAVSRLKGEVR